MQVYAGMASHVVSLARVGIEVGLRTGLDTGIEERQTVLRHHGRIVIAGDDLQPPLQVLGLVEEAGLLLAFRILLRGVHIAFAIHHLIRHQ